MLKGITLLRTRYCLTQPIALSTWIRNDAILRDLVISVLDKRSPFTNGGVLSLQPCVIHSYDISKPLSAMTESPGSTRSNMPLHLGLIYLPYTN